MALFDSGWIPDGLYGVSCGALAAAYLAHCRGGGMSWPDTGHSLWTFMQDSVGNSDSIVTRYEPAEIASLYLDKRPIAFLDSTKLARLLINSVSLDNLRKCDVPLRVGATDYVAGEYETFRFEDFGADFMECILGSASVPFEFIPHKVITADGKRTMWLFDGGVLRISPVQDAIDEGATEGVAVICGYGGAWSPSFDPTDPLQIAQQTISIGVSRTFEDDTRAIPPNWSVSRPSEDVYIDMSDFALADVIRCQAVGVKDGRELVTALSEKANRP